MFYFAKTLQAAAMGVVLLAFYVGVREDSMAKEITMLGIGSVVFLLGRLLENSVRG